MSQAVSAEAAPGATVSEDGNPPSSSETTRLARGTTVGRYIIVDFIGAGGMGSVYAAYDFALDRRVCLKFVRDGARSADRQHRLIREGQALARLSHPNVIAVYDVGSFGEQVFIAMELVEGGTLRDWLKRPRSWREIVEVFSQAARGLAAAHQAGLVHRDFKPENALLGTDGRVRVTDFGLAVDCDEASALHGRAPGTPAYLAPEVRRGSRPDARSDQFAFATSLFEALAGKHPFGDTLEDIVRRSAAGEYQELSGPAPRRVAQTVARGLAADPDDRHDSLDGFARALRSARKTSLWKVAALGATVGAAGTLWASSALTRPPDVIVSEREVIRWMAEVPSTLVAPRRVSRAPSPPIRLASVAIATEPPAQVERIGVTERRIDSRFEPEPLAKTVLHALASNPSSHLVSSLVAALSRLQAVIDGAPATPPTNTSWGSGVVVGSSAGGNIPSADAAKFASLIGHLASSSDASVASLVASLEDRIAHARTPAERAEAQFELAQVMWTNQPSERVQAVQLARHAKETLAVTAPDDVPAVDDWLSERALKPDRRANDPN